MALDDAFADILLADPPPKRRKPAPVDDPFGDIPIAGGGGADPVDPFADIPVSPSPAPVAPPPVARPAAPSPLGRLDLGTGGAATFAEYADALTVPAAPTRTASSRAGAITGARYSFDPAVRDAAARQATTTGARQAERGLLMEDDQRRAQELRVRGARMDADGSPIANRFGRSLAGFYEKAGRGLREYGRDPFQPTQEIDLGSDGATTLAPLIGKVGYELEQAGKDVGRRLGAQGGELESFRDIRSARDVAKYAGQQTVNVAASVLGAVATGGAGTVLTLQGEAADAIDQAAGRADVEVDPRMRAAASLTAGGAAAALEFLSLGVMTAPIRRALGREVAKELTEQVATKGLEEAIKRGGQSYLTRLGRGVAGATAAGAKSSVTEGTTEFTQQMLTGGAAPLAAGVPIDTDEVLEQSLEAGAAGAAGSFGLGGTGGTIESYRNARRDRTLFKQQERADYLMKALTGGVKRETSGVAPEAEPAAPSVTAAPQRARTPQEAARGAELEAAIGQGGLAPDELAAMEAELAALPPRPVDIGDGTPVPMAPPVAPAAPAADRRATPRGIPSRFEAMTDDELEAERLRLANLPEGSSPFEGFARSDLEREQTRRAEARTKQPLPGEADPLPTDDELAFIHREIPDDLLEQRRAAEVEELIIAPPTPAIQSAIRRKIAVLDAERARRGRSSSAVPTAPLAVSPTEPVSVPRETKGDEARAAVAPRTGRKTTLIFPDGGNKVEAQYEVREADELVASHNPVTFEPDGRYPAAVQGRAYDKDKAAQDYVAQATLGYDPDKALDPTRIIGAGPTVITADGVAIAGNQRLMIRQRASEQQPQRVKAYIDQLIANAGEYGINADDIRGMRNPVLVRVITDKSVDTSDLAALKELNRRSDEVDTKTKRATDEAAGTAAALGADPELLAFLSDAMAEDDTLTLAEFFDTARGKDFIRRLVVAEIIPRSRVAQLIRGEPASGKLTDEGKGFVRRMLLASALEDVTLLDRVPQRMLLKMERAIPAIIVSQRIPGYGLAARLRVALEVFAEASDKNLTPAQIVDQIALGEAPMPERLKKLVLWLDKADSKKLREGFQQYGEQAQKYAVPEVPVEDDGFGLGDTRITKSPDDLMDQMSAANLFDQGESGPGMVLLSYVPKQTAEELQADLFFGEKPKVTPPAGALVFDASRKDAGYRSAWATVMDDRQRARVAAGNASQAFLDAFAFLRGNAKMLPEEAMLRGDGQGSFLTDNADQSDMFASTLADTDTALPETVDVNGVERTTRNSEGRPIAGSVDAVVAFWRWFGESKVVDEFGRPRVVYHGTNVDLAEFRPGSWFAASPALANEFVAGGSMNAGNRPGPGSGMYPVYLRIENPLDVTRIDVHDMSSLPFVLNAAGLPSDDVAIEALAREVVETGSGGFNPTVDPVDYTTRVLQQVDRLYAVLERKIVMQVLQRAGFDGVFARENLGASSLTFRVFDGGQVKSAIGNDGSFDVDSRAINSQFDLFGSAPSIDPDDPSLPMADDWTGEIPESFRARYGSDRNPVSLVQMAAMFQKSGKQQQANDIIAELARRGVSRYGRRIGPPSLQQSVPVEPVQIKKDTPQEINLPKQAITAEAMRSAAIGRFRALLQSMRAIPDQVNGRFINALTGIRPVRMESDAIKQSRTREEALALVPAGTDPIATEELVKLYMGPGQSKEVTGVYDGLRYLGVSFAVLDALENNTSLKLVGQKIASIQDLALMLLAVRDPFIEVGRTIFLDADNNIVGHEVNTIGLPNATPTVSDWIVDEYNAIRKAKLMAGNPNYNAKLTRDETIALLQKRYPTAVSFYDVHNHPNGSPVPSQGDLKATRQMAEFVDTGVYMGGLVINGTTYSLVESTVSFNDATNLHTPLPGETFADMVQRVGKRFLRENGLEKDPLLTADPEFDDPRVWDYRGTDKLMLTGQKETDLAKLIKEMYRPDLSQTLAIVFDAFRNVRAIIDVPNDAALLKSQTAVKEYIERVQRSMGGSAVLIATSNKTIADRASKVTKTVGGKKSGAVTAVHIDGQQLIALNTYGLDVRQIAFGDGAFSTLGGRIQRTGVAQNLVDVMRDAANLGWLDRLTRINMVTEKAIIRFKPPAEQQYKGNQGVPDKWKTRVAAAQQWMKSLPEAIPALGRPTRDAVTTLTNELLLMMRRSPAHSQQLAVDFIADVLEGFTREQVDLFQRKLITDDLIKDVENSLYTNEGGNPLPIFGRDAKGNRRPLADAVADLMAANADVTTAIGNDPVVTAGLALMRTKREALVKALVDEEILSAEATADERYYHRQVLEFYRAMDSQPQSVARRGIRQVKSGYQKRRSGGGEFNSLYVESEFEWLAQSYEKLLARKIEKQITAIADQAPAMRRAAKDQNRATFYKKIQPLMDDYALGKPIPAWLEALLPDRSLLPPMLPFNGPVFGTQFDPLSTFRQRIALNTMRVYAETVNGSYQVAQLAPFANLIRAIEQWDAAGRVGYFDHPQWFAFLNAIASDDTLPGSISAKAIYKAMQERDELIENIVGEAFVTGEDLERAAGLVSWQPVKGRTLYKASTLAEDVIDEILNGTRDLERDDLQEVMVQGGLKERWAVPKHIAAALDDPSAGLGTIGRFSFERVWMRGMALWKFWQLYSPTRFVKYNLNNTSSDVDVSFLYPKMMAGAKGALSDLRAQAQGVAKLSPQLRDELRLWQRHGAIDSGQYASELGDVWKHREFEKLADPNPLSVMRVMGMYPSFVTGFAQVRENTLRLAAARYFKAEMDRTGRIPTVIASNPAIVRNLWDSAPKAERNTMVAARLARDLIGDYQSVSSAGSWLRSRLLPFFAWQELNVKRYFWLMRNAAKDPEGVNTGALARTAGAALFRTSTNAALIALKVHVFFLAATLWNNWRFKDEEEKLRRNGRGLHLIYGVDKDGNIGTIRLESAFAAFLKLVALEDYPADVKDIRAGKKSYSKQSREMAQAPVNQFILAWEPVTKGMMEGLAGVSLYPDPMNPRPAKEPLRDWLNGQGIGYLDDLYRTVSGEPVPPRKPGPMAEGLSVGERLVKTFDMYAGYRTDPGEAAYWNMRQMIAEYVAAETGRDLAPARLDQQQLAIYYAKAASRWGLEDKAQEWLAEYYKRGGTPLGARGSVTSMDPLKKIPDNIQGKFLRSLSESDKEMLRDAREWWRRDQRASFRKVLTSVPYSQVRQQMRDDVK